tara:strand:+ start:103 stop:957 length:855 start_codon:yes stop_codon:yes gene_type:complete
MLAYLKLPHHLEEILNEEGDDTIPDLPPALPTPPAPKSPPLKPRQSLEDASIEFAEDTELSSDVDCELPGADPNAFTESINHTSTPIAVILLGIAAIGAVLAIVFTQRPETSVLSQRDTASEAQPVEDSTTPREPTLADINVPSSDVPTKPSTSSAAAKDIVEPKSDTAKDVETAPKSQDTKPVLQVVRIEAKPASAIVFKEGAKERLGQVPIDVPLKKGEDKLKLRIWAEGYETAKMILRPDDIGKTRSVNLKKSFKKKRPTKKRKPKPKEAPIPSSLDEALN